MKKLIAVALVAMLVFCLIGCTKTTEVPASAEPAAAAEPATESAAEPAFTTVNPGVLCVALSPDFSPMEFVDTAKSGQEQYVGFDVTLSNYLADELGLELEIKPMSFDACQTAVQLGSVDMSISGFSWTAEREENFCISDYYIAGDNETEQSIISLKENEGKLTTAEAFADLKVAAQAASLQEKLCTEALPESTQIELFKSLDDAVLALKTGKVDAIAVAHGNGEAIMVNNPDIAFTGFDFEVDPKYENNVILLNKQSTALLAAVNELLGKAMAQDLYTGWYDDAKALAGIETAADVTYDDEGNVAS